MSGKRSYTQYAGRPSANYKAARMVGGKVLRYNPSRPVAGSSRYRSQILRSTGELKGCDVAVNTGALVTVTTNTNADIFGVNFIQPGNGSWNRVGRKITMTSLRIVGAVNLVAPAATAAGGIFRMVVFYDKQPNSAATPAWNEIFGSTTQDGTEAAVSALAPLRYDVMDRFVVLRDKRWEGNNMASGTTSMTCQFNIDEYIKLPNLTTVYSGQSNPCTIADIATGALYVAFRGGSIAGMTAFGVTGSLARLRYSDL